MRIGFVGLGTNVHHHAAAVTGEAECAAVVAPPSAARERFARMYDIPCQYDSLDDMLNDGFVDAVCLDSPRPLRAIQAIACLYAGVAVLVETPMATDADSARAMWCAAESTCTPLMVAHGWRFDAGVHSLKSQRETGSAASPLRSTVFGIETRALVDAIDRGRFLLGDPQPVSVYANFDTVEPGRDTGVVVVTWKCGGSSIIESRGEGQYAPPCIEEVYREQMAHFIDCVMRRVQPCVNGAHGYLTMCIIDAAYASARIGKVIEL